MNPNCVFCEEIGGELLWQGKTCRVILAQDSELPGFCRVVWQNHVREMTELAPQQRRDLMSVVWCVEEGVRNILCPDKINLASLGNQTPHLHWHVIPRWRTDSRFPQPIWHPPLRAFSTDTLEIPVDWRTLLIHYLQQHLAGE